MRQRIRSKNEVVEVPETGEFRLLQTHSDGSGRFRTSFRRWMKREEAERAKTFSFMRWNAWNLPEVAFA